MPISLYEHIRSQRHRLRSIAGRSPAVLNTYGRVFERAFWRNLAPPDADIVIDGFGGSGNSFAVLAFEAAQPSRVKIAHHSHMPFQFTLADRYGIPSLWLIREPLSTASSLVSRGYVPSGKVALRDYVAFFRYILDRKPTLAFATFEQVTTDFGQVTARVNTQFGTNFAEFVHTEPNVESAFASMLRPDSIKAAPSAHRKAAVVAAREEISRAAPSLLAEAKAVYAEALEAANA